LSLEIDIGHGITIKWADEGRTLMWKHPKCRAWWWLAFKPDPRSTGHVLASREPLTIIGSLLCTDCNTHGTIENGRWVPA
jgi:hypothetical protein